MKLRILATGVAVAAASFFLSAMLGHKFISGHTWADDIVVAVATTGATVTLLYQRELHKQSD